MADKEKDKEEKPKAAAKAKPDAAKIEKAKAASKGPKVEGGEQVAPKVIRLREKYQKEIIPALKEKFKFKNVMAVPKLTKVCLNMGFGKPATDNNPKVGEVCLADM